MAKKKAAWYPSGNYKNYAYSTSLEKETSKKAQTAWKEAKSLIASAHNAVSAESDINTVSRSYVNLNRLWKREREAEQAFIQKYLKTNIDYSDKDETQQILLSINEIANSKSLFESAKAQVKGVVEHQQGVTTTAVQALSTYQLPGVIKTSILKYIEKLDIEKTPSQIFDELYKKLYKEISAVLEKVLYYVEVNTEENPYKDLVEYLENTESKSAFIKEIMKAYGIDKTAFEKSRKKNKKTVKEAMTGLALNANDRGGSVAETFMLWFSKEVGDRLNKGMGTNKNSGIVVTNVDTASLNNQKADLILLFGKAQFNTADLERDFLDVVGDTRKNEDSRRLQNIAAIEKMIEQCEGADMVFISEKSYNLSGNTFKKGHKDYGGFGAESPDIKSVGKTLSKGQLSSNTLSDLIFLLANSGERMINGRDVEDVTRVVALNIASFLFDDVVITDALDEYHSTTNRIHLFNLNGIMVPLSVFLEGVAVAIENNWTELADYIVIKLHAPRITPNDDPILDENDWIKFYNQRLSENKLNIHFFGDFNDFIYRNISV